MIKMRNRLLLFENNNTRSLINYISNNNINDSNTIRHKSSSTTISKKKTTSTSEKSRTTDNIRLMSRSLFEELLSEELSKEEPKELREPPKEVKGQTEEESKGPKEPSKIDQIEEVKIELALPTKEVSLNALDFLRPNDKKRKYTPIESDSKYPESPEEIKIITSYTEAKKKLLMDNLKSWEKDELEHLLSQVEKHGKKWKLLSNQYAQYSKMRSAASLCAKFQNWIKRISQSNFDPNWSEDEDRRLRIGIMTFGVSAWKKIADLVETKDSEQVQERWRQICLNVRGKWSEEENQILNKLVEDHGKNWAQFAGVLARPANYIRLHYEYETGRWTEEETKLLHDTLKKEGFNWTKIKEKFPKRKIGKIRAYLDKHANVNPFVMHGRWTNEEKARFKQGFDEYGTVWSRVSQVVKSRTQGQCSNHFKYFKNYISDEDYKRLIIDRMVRFKDIRTSKQGRFYGKSEIKELLEKSGLQNGEDESEKK